MEGNLNLKLLRVELEDSWHKDPQTPTCRTIDRRDDLAKSHVSNFVIELSII